VKVTNYYQNISKALDWLGRDVAVYNASKIIIDDINIRYDRKREMWEVSYTPNQSVFKEAELNHREIARSETRKRDSHGI